MILWLRMTTIFLPILGGLLLVSCGDSKSPSHGKDAAVDATAAEADADCTEELTCGSQTCGIVSGCGSRMDCGACDSGDWCSAAGICEALPTATSIENQPHSVFVVHLEPGIMFAGENVWEEGLVPMVQAADTAQIPLTIFMQAQWVDYVLDASACTFHPGFSSCVDLVRSWVQTGRTDLPTHEIGLHNHGPAHSAQPESGYSEWDPQHAEDLRLALNGKGVYPDSMNGTFLELHRGSLEPVVARLETELLGGLEIRSGTIMQPWHESPGHIQYETSQRSGGKGENSRIVRAEAWGADGYHPTHLLISTTCTGNCSQGVSVFQSMTSDQVFINTSHGHNFRTASHRSNIEDFFALLVAKDMGNVAGKRRTLSDVMENIVIPRDSVLDGYCGDGFCDAREACPEGVSPNAAESCDPYQIWDGDNEPSCAIDCIGMSGSGTGSGPVLLDSGAVIQSDSTLAVQDGSVEYSLDAQGDRHVRLSDASMQITLGNGSFTGERFIKIRGQSAGTGDVSVTVNAGGSVLCTLSFGVEYSVQRCGDSFDPELGSITISESSGQLFIDSVAYEPVH